MKKIELLFEVAARQKEHQIMNKLSRFLLLWLFLLATPLAQAENFSFQDTLGKTHTLAGYRGKWVLVNFWSTTCPACIDEIPDLVALHDKHHAKDLVVIGVAMDYREGKQVIRFADDYFISYPIVLGNGKLATQVGPVLALPTTYLYDPQGKLVAQHTGALTQKAVESYIAGKQR